MMVFLYAAFPGPELSVFSFIFAGSAGGTSGMHQPVPGAHQQVKGLDCQLRGFVKQGQGLVAGKDESRPLWGPAPVLDPAGVSSGQRILGHPCGAHCLPRGPAETIGGFVLGGPSVVWECKRLLIESCSTLKTSLTGKGKPCRLL